uniref:Uncharacterized protein n=1 Tax=Tetraselmis chuii TaxID=63592 RepID=A0A7S1X4F6_9CHLO
MRREALVIKGKNKKHRTPRHRVGGSTHHRRRFSDSDGLEDSRKSLGDTFSSSGYSSDSWSDEEEDFEGTRVAEYRGKLWRRQKQETEPSVPEATAPPNLSESFRRSDGLINRLGSTLQEAGHSAAKLTKSLSLDRPRTSLPVGVCNLGSLPKSRSSLVERGKQQQTSRSFSGRLPSIKRREDIYRIDSAMEEKGLREGVARMPMPSASSASGAKMIALPHFPPKADRAGGGGGQGPQLTRSQSRV